VRGGNQIENIERRINGGETVCGADFPGGVG
jgi:hypothetical protein